MESNFEQGNNFERSREEAVKVLLKLFMKEAGFNNFSDNQLSRQVADLARETGLPAEQVKEIITSIRG